MSPKIVVCLWAAGALAAAQDLQSGPTAHFSMVGQGQFAGDGGTLNISAAGGSASVALMSTSAQGSAAITSYSWMANGMNLGCAGASCTATLSMASGMITLTVTDGNGKTSTAFGSVNIRSQAGPRAAFSMSAGGQSGHNGGTLTVPPGPGGGITVSLSSSSSTDGPPIAGYVWSANGVPQACSGSGCTMTFTLPSNTVSLTVTDSVGQSATASAVVRIAQTQ